MNTAGCPTRARTERESQHGDRISSSRPDHIRDIKITSVTRLDDSNERVARDERRDAGEDVPWRLPVDERDREREREAEVVTSADEVERAADAVGRPALSLPRAMLTGARSSA
jgi:hypothetical protein